MAVPQAFLAKDQLPRMSRQSRLSANEKRENDMTPEVVDRYPDIRLTAEKNRRKPRLGDRLMKVMRPVIASNGVPFLQMKSVASRQE